MCVHSPPAALQRAAIVIEFEHILLSLLQYISLRDLRRGDDVRAHKSRFVNNNIILYYINVINAHYGYDH